MNKYLVKQKLNMLTETGLTESLYNNNMYKMQKCIQNNVVI